MVCVDPVHDDPVESSDLKYLTPEEIYANAGRPDTVVRYGLDPETIVAGDPHADPVESSALIYFILPDVSYIIAGLPEMMAMSVLLTETPDSIV